MTKIVSKKTEKHLVSDGLPKPKKQCLTGNQLASHPAFGMWKNREDLGDGTTFVRMMREQEGKRSWK
jgi:hypothetical protein